MTVLVLMDEAEYTAYIQQAVPAFASEKVVAGQWSSNEALAMAQQSFEALLPLGRSTPGHNLLSIRADDAVTHVGVLWFAVQERAGQPVAYIYDFMVRQLYQRQGHGTRAFALLEEKLRPLGYAGIALHVFGHNRAAQALYARLGLQPTNINLFKPLAAGGGV